ETDILGGSLDLLAQTGNLDVVVYGRGFPSRMDRRAPTGQIWEQVIEKHPDILFLLMSLVSGHLHASQSADLEVAEPMVRLGEVLFLQGSEYGLKAIAALVRYAEFVRTREARQHGTRLRRTLEGVGERARALIRAAGGRGLTERESKA